MVKHSHREDFNIQFDSIGSPLASHVKLYNFFWSLPLWALELLIRYCVIVNNVIIVLRIIIVEHVYLEIAIYVLQNSSKSCPNNY
jgi:hypothetical protein